MTEEVWYRAGQLAAVHPLFDQGLWPPTGPTQGSLLERREGYARDIPAGEDLRPGEVLVGGSDATHLPYSASSAFWAA